MSFPASKRKRITINNQPVVAVDYPASQANVLYQHITGRFLYPEDPYQVDGLHRDSAKFMMQMMLNNKSRHAASMAAKTNLETLKKPKRERLEKETKKFGSLSKIMDAIADRNAPIASCFYQGKAKGQYYAWLEPNLVFEVARYLAEIEVPALTVHDEFIVPEGMEDAVLECRYTVGLDERVYGENY